jgi:hypothetical protein
MPLLPTSTSPAVISTATGTLGNFAPILYVVVGFFLALFVARFLIHLAGSAIERRRDAREFARLSRVLTAAGYTVVERIPKTKAEIETAEALKEARRLGLEIKKHDEVA